jgi:hypothetical protein
MESKVEGRPEKVLTSGRKRRVAAIKLKRRVMSPLSSIASEH